ncbi:hypothetical protein H6P81_011417 [Aristolochia fimbriata]|uniref:Glycosyltransferase n=1 Tax=Aristolochia fimbriata TaxID=158543 RepID=A0AAV7EUY7_ARIFI|nr:hypothetical protein H6P81_011417 [Aristolochia fimbriata]
MDDAAGKEKPHAVCVPYPAQGHITPMLKLAKLLHHRGFHITFVHTEYNHQRLLRSRGASSLKGLENFRFETIPDGLPPSDCDHVTQDIPTLSDSTSKTCLVPFTKLLKKLNQAPDLPSVSCIVSDGAMSFTLDAAQELQVPEVVFWTPSACGFMCYLHYQKLIELGITPLKDESYLTDRDFLDSVIDCIPGLVKNFRFRDIPSFVRTTNPDEIMLNYVNREAQRASKAAAVVLNTFYELEREVLDSMASILPRIYSVGPLQILCDQIPDDKEGLNNIGANLWREEQGSLEWLDAKEPKSVIYVNFGSIAVMSPHQLVEFAWGLANSEQSFLWVIRPDLVKGETAIVPPEFVEVTSERGLLLSWVPQEKVLSHPSVAGFLTHCGWNSMLESICHGVPVICWPFFAEQQTNCRYACDAWGIGMEMDDEVKREEVKRLVRELMEGEKGKEMRKKALRWKTSAEKATNPGGSSCLDLDKLVRILLTTA